LKDRASKEQLESILAKDPNAKYRVQNHHHQSWEMTKEEKLTEDIVVKLAKDYSINKLEIKFSNGSKMVFT